MAIRKILALGDPREKILHTKAKKVSRFDAHLARLVEDMWATMRAAPGVGLAAPQIGESIRVLVAEYDEEHVALVNPEIIKQEGEELGTEGCLSIPGVVGDNVPRATTIVVKGRDPKGKEIRIHADGWYARVLQHEIDHLDGVLYIDRIKPRDVREVRDEDISEEGGPQPEALRSSRHTGERNAMNGKNGKNDTLLTHEPRTHEPAERAPTTDAGGHP